MNTFDFIRVEGIGSRRKGVNKSGNPYDFVPVYITYDPKPGSNITGRAAAEILVDTMDVDRIRPQPGEEFTVTLMQSRSGLSVRHWIERGRVELTTL